MSGRKTFEIVVTEDAATDLESIGDYLAEHRSRQAAAEWTAAVLDRVGQLEYFPRRGAVPHELEAFGPTPYKQVLFGNYRIFYRVDDGRVLVLLIADGRRDIAALLRDRLLGPGASA